MVSEWGKLGDIAGDGRGRGKVRLGSREFVEDADLERGEGELWWCLRLCSIDHGQPEAAPAEDAERREQIDEAFGRA
jgi:hypothetical protein